MSAFVKKYPRARIAPHPTLNGWVIDILMGAKARPSRVKATYASIPFALKAAHDKLGVKDQVSATTAPAPLPPAEPASAGLTVFERPVRVKQDAGTCTPCGRPMRAAGTKASDYPGTTLRQREGLCQSCNQRAKKEQAA